MFFYIKTAYFQNLPSTAPPMDLGHKVYHELTMFETDCKAMEDAADAALGFSFLAAFTSDKSWKLQLCKLNFLFYNLDLYGHNHSCNSYFLIN